MALRKKPDAARRRWVRVVLTEEEHADLRLAAAAADLSLSHYASQAILNWITLQRGLYEAKAGQFVDPPDLAAGDRLAEEA